MRRNMSCCAQRECVLSSHLCLKIKSVISVQKKKINRVCFLLFFFNFSTSWLAVSRRSGRLLFTASVASRQSGALTAWAPGCRSAAFGRCHSGDWCRCRCGAELREVGHGPAGCVQSKQGLIMHKVSHAALFFTLCSCV